MLHLGITPDADGYTHKEGNENIAVMLDGGRSRVRKDKVGAVDGVQVRWTLTPWQYQYMRAFFTTGVQRGALPFTCDLVSQDGSAPEPHVCTFVPDTFALSGQHGLTYVVSATLEVTPLARNTDLDNAVIILGPFEDPLRLLEGLERLVTITMPETIGA